MAEVLTSVPVNAPADAVFRLILDQRQRARFLPDGWSVRRLVTSVNDGVGATMEIDARIGPGLTPMLVQVQEVRDRTPEAPMQIQLVEAPPAADNYITTWTVQDEIEVAVVYLHIDFSYGGFLGEIFAKRSLVRACVQMLERLKALAESEARERRG